MMSTLRFILSHPVSRRRPLAALARYASWQVASRLGGTIEFEWIDGSKLLVRNGMTGATGNIYCGLHEFSDMAFLLHLLRPEDLFVDVGANIGSYTILAAAVCSAQVIAAEPDPVTMASLQANVEANQAAGRVELIEAALGAQAGTIQFTSGLDTVNHVATAGEGHTRDVSLRTLDEVVGGRHPLLIKMDVEGYEAQVLAGAGEVLKDPALLAIITEGDGPEVRQRLADHGFQEFSYEPFTRQLKPSDAHGSVGPQNALFLRDAPAVAHRLMSASRRIVAGVEI
jgi:FkbM family methyltransferase